MKRLILLLVLSVLFSCAADSSDLEQQDFAYTSATYYLHKDLPTPARRGVQYAGPAMVATNTSGADRPRWTDQVQWRWRYYGAASCEGAYAPNCNIWVPTPQVLLCMSGLQWGVCTDISTGSQGGSGTTWDFAGQLWYTTATFRCYATFQGTGALTWVPDPGECEVWLTWHRD